MTSPTYIPLRVHSPYSLAEGAIFLSDLANRLKEWRLPAACVADTNSISGAYSIASCLTKVGAQPLQGVQIEVSHPGLTAGSTETSEIVLIAMNEAGYEQICRFLSIAQTTLTPLSIKDLLRPDHSDQFLVLTGGQRGPVDNALIKGAPDRARQRLASFKKILGDRLYCEIQRQGGPEVYQSDLVEMARDLEIPCVATSEAWFLDRSYAEAHDALLCIADGVTLNHDTRRRADPNGHLKSPEEMQDLFADIPQALENTVELAKRCTFIIAKKDPMLPAFPTKGGRNEAEELKAQSIEGLEKRLADISFDEDGKSIHGYTKEDYQTRLSYELDVIEGMGFPGYFLIVADFIAWSKENDIPVGPGRGSGAGSLVAWVLTITDLDPLRYGLFFERFLNPERVSMPDFDIDFCQERRDEVIDYVRQKYGEERVAQIGTIGKLQAKAVLRDVGRVMQIPFPVVDRYAKLLSSVPSEQVPLAEAMTIEPLVTELQNADEDILRMFDIGTRLEGLFRNQSTHAAGVVIGDRPIHEIVPTYKDNHGTIVTAFDMKSVENASLVKFDFLGLKTLDVIKGACDISERAGQPVNLDVSDTEDKETYEMLQRGESFGVFQLESPGMRKAMLQIQPTCIEDIVALVSLYRPGPMENIPTYARVKSGEEEAHYLHPGMQGPLEETYGIIVYQEQVMQLARDLAGYSLGGADMLRRAMGKKIASEMEAQREIFQEGAKKRGIAPEVASEIFDLIARFANYGFNKSHAAAYAVIAYQTAYLRCHHPHAFLAASMNFDINDVDKIAEALENARRSGISCLPPDINSSQAYFDVESNNGAMSVRHGLCALRGVGANMAKEVVAERERGGPFKSIFDFVKRTKANINKKLLESLIAAGAMDSLNMNRNAMMTAVPNLLSDATHRQAEKERGQFTMFDIMPVAQEESLPDVPDWSLPEKLQRQHKVVGFYIDGHPIEQVRSVLNRFANSRRIVDIYEDSENLEREISVGVVIAEVIFKRTSNKDPMVILKVSDETGMTEIIAFKETAEYVRDQIKQAEGPAARFTLSVSDRNGEISLFVRDIEPLKLEFF
jgi:DNA polymerase III subunit alpha